MPCVHSECRKTDMVDMLIPIDFNPGNLQCPASQTQKIYTSGISIGSTIGVQSEGTVSAFNPMLLIAVVFLILIIIQKARDIRLEQLTLMSEQSQDCNLKTGEQLKDISCLPLYATNIKDHYKTE